ncbi:MAG TPA: endopeptidase La [Deltaproteobacteria bacterium]|nr:endopeptidase La [Deltaproteobacteria bacterium]OQC28915.1 MAG: Lon protease 1 [Deltaproteobacteria bacterium ADurb.Bin072]HRW81386.1 endopeptidase La [Desulfomonilia bacterium]HNQ84446.1 endopeptidase La [Deltaproteobacteria bacterium]HNS90166.1 endopeptidase La [Deltaproteobacteria bacterium]
MENEKQAIEIPENIPLLPIRDVVIYPYMILPLFVGRGLSIKAVDEALNKDRYIFLAAQKDSTIEEPAEDQIYTVGTVAMVIRMLKLPDGRVKILVQGVAKARIKRFVKDEKGFFSVDTVKIEEPELKEITVEVEAMMRTVKEQSERILQLRGIVSPDALSILEAIDDPGRLADLVASNLRLKVDESQNVLEIIDPVERLRHVNGLLSKEMELSEVQARIQSQAKEEMSKTQREYFLREQLRAIQQELGEVDEKGKEIEEYLEKINAAGMPEDVKKEATKQLERLKMMHQDSAEANIIRTYLDWMTDLPWGTSTQDRLDIKAAAKILDEDHYGLDKVKQRILEYLAVRKLNPEKKGAILCFVGPPGVGKTSLGRSIARALGREFYRLSIGGVRDEAEIRGHRRTYIGAMPGRVIQGIKQAGSNNPVFMIDEVDKIGQDFRGDPSSALLEVLDPEQNFSFQDHYLNVPFDLSRVMFITTANLTDPIPGPLKDRMEVIELPGYTDQEKLQIAKRYLVTRQVGENGMKVSEVKFSDEAILDLINHYTKEAGVRNLEREIGSICRKVARKIAEKNGRRRKLFRISAKNVSAYLGVPKFMPEQERKEHEVGVSTGLAWTQFGGEILYIEASVLPCQEGKGGQLVLTGHLGDVMKESAQAGMTYIRSRAKQFGISETFNKDNDIHVHIPAGAIPKDGPSAGITMATAVVSALTNRAVRKDIAMTGEITLRGKVLPIGGLKEKTLAAHRNKIFDIIIPKENEKDLEEIPPVVKKKLTFHPVSSMDDVLKYVFVDDKAEPKARPKQARSAREKASNA